MRKYGKWLLVLGVLAASPAWVSADGFLSGSSSAQTSRTTQKQVNQHRAEQVAYALKQARLNGYDFEVEVRGDTVKLEGKVRDVTHRALASNVCRKVPGIQNIKNNIQYVPSGNIQQTGGSFQAGGLSTAAFSSAGNTGGIQQVRYSKPGRRSKSTQKTTTTQQRFTQQVRQAAPSTPAPPALSYESAAPKTEAAPKQQATQAVEKQSDAAPATPFIDLTSSKSAAPAGPSNQQVAETIAQQLASVGLIGYDVTARFENGVATLAGEVATQDQRKAAEYATSMIPSVKNVVNQLQVKGPIAQTAFAGAGGQVTPASMSFAPQPMAQPGGMMPAPAAMGPAGNYSNPQLPDHAWPAYAQYPNSAAIQYPKQYSASAWPYIGPFYPYPQVPLGWREVSMEWDDGMWQLDFNKKKDAWYWLFAPRNWH